jgi:hypothetical protein
MGGRRTNTCFQKDDEAWRDRLTGGGKATRLMYDKRLPKKPTSLGAMLCCDVNLQEACVCVCALLESGSGSLARLPLRPTMSLSEPLSFPVLYKLVIFISNCYF